MQDLVTHARKFHLVGLILLALAILIRGLTLEVSDLVDPTEARYAAVAQQMVQTGNWLTPQIPSPAGVIPYLGKPPLHFWLTATAYSFFGVEEWTSRLPSFLGAVIIILCAVRFAASKFDLRTGLIGALILASSAIFFLFSGASALDITLAASTAVAMLAFAERAPRSPRGAWGLLFFVALALGFMIKGPVAIVLIALPLLLWTSLTKEWARLTSLPWVSGAAAFFVICVPWFFLQERANPGFLNYFFIQENIGRYLFKNYGDRYGSGHVHPYGTSWLFLGAGVLPWALVPVVSLLRGVRPSELLALKPAQSRWLLYAIIWGIAPALFFTFARQLHIGYIIPGIAGISIASAWCVTALLDAGYRAQLQQFVVVVASIAILASLSLIGGASFFSLTSPFHLQVVALALTGLFLACFSLRYRHQAMFQLGLTCVALVSCFGGLIFALSTQSNQASSSRSAINAILAVEPEFRPTIGIITENTYSHYFYSLAWQGELSRAVQIQYVSAPNINDSALKHLLIKNKDLRSVPKQALVHFSSVVNFGKWTWLKRGEKGGGSG